MRVLSRLLLTLCLLAVLSPPVQARSFPSTGDALEAAQQRWGSVQPGYIAEGCVVTPSSGMTVQIGACTAFVLDRETPPALKGVSDTAHTLTLSGVDGRYWIGLRSSPGVAVSGWTCLDGRHTCWVKSDTPPAAVSGLLPLATTTVTAGVAGASVVMAPWSRSTPYVVPAGTTLTLGVCPEAGRWPIFDANGTTSGLIRFGPGACGTAYPEWWGADPTGLADSTAQWQQAIDAVSGQGGVNDTSERVPLACEGSYKVTGALTVRPRLGIHGRHKPSTSGAKTVACEFLYSGAGNLFVAPLLYTPPDPIVGYSDLDFRHMRIVDVLGTAERAFEMYHPSGMTMQNIYVGGFNVPWYFMGSLIYSKLDGLITRFYRQRCLEISGPANFADISVTCGASQATVEHGVRVGVEPNWFGASQNLRLRASVEAASGSPIILAEQRGLDAELYVEQPGECSAYDVYGAIWLFKVHGGRVHLSASGNCHGGPPQIARGLYVNSTPEVASSGVDNVIFTGRIHNNYAISVAIEKGPGMWGNNLTGLQYAREKSTIGDFTTGIVMGESYWTHGLVPAVDEGMGSTDAGTVWRMGSLIWNQGGANESANYFHQVVVEGNPPQVARLQLSAVNGLVVPVDVGVPTLREGNTFHSRILVDGDPDTPITDFQQAIGGLCIDLTARGTRTIASSAGSTGIKLSSHPNPYVMNEGNTLRLCADSALGPWRETSRCATCPP